jgi:hypothetical protein
VPDETDRVLVMRPVGPKLADWPDADFIVGNPPFNFGKHLRSEIGHGYAEAYWALHPHLPEAADYAMAWWDRCARLAAEGKVRRFGLLTSKNITMVFSRRVVQRALSGRPPVSIVFAIPDHPWVDGTGMAMVRIAFTVAEGGDAEGRLWRVVKEESHPDGEPRITFAPEEVGRINADLTIGADATAARPLEANRALSYMGVALNGDGFLVTPGEAAALGLGKVPGLEKHIRPYLNGRDFAQRSRGFMVIDLFGLSEDEARHKFPAAFQHVLVHVKPKRDVNARESIRRFWWQFGWPRPELRRALTGLPRYIATVETMRHRIFAFMPAELMPDNKFVCIAAADGFTLGVLQSRLHVAWATAAGGRLGVGNDPVYSKTVCFDPFPFPNATAAQRAEIAAVAEELDAHRKARLAAHPHLTLTGLYNVLAAIRAGKPLSAAEKDVHDAGQVSILRALHDRLDAAVAASYGWPAGLSDAAVVAHVVALNAERVKEEAAGTVRWLRPEFQAPEETRRKAVQTEMAVGETAAPGAVAWPKDVPSQFIILRTALTRGPASAQDVSRRFKGAPRGAKMAEMLATLAALGQARPVGDGRYVA